MSREPNPLTNMKPGNKVVFGPMIPKIKQHSNNSHRSWNPVRIGAVSKMTSTDVRGCGVGVRGPIYPTREPGPLVPA